MCHTSDYSNCWGIPSGFLRSTPARKRSEFPGTELDRSAACWLQLPARGVAEQDGTADEPGAHPFPEIVPSAWQAPTPPSHEDCGASPASTSNYFNSMRY